MPCRTGFTLQVLLPALLVFFLLTPALWPQQVPDLSVLFSAGRPAAPLVLRTSAREVNLVFSVTDHRGKFISKLTSSDLTVFDNNQKQTALTFFQSETDLPLRIALLLDISASVGARFDAEQSTIHSFLKTVVRPGDSAVLFAFNQRVQMVAPVAEDWKQTRKRVKKLKPRGETAIYDAIASASQWLDADHRPARRLIILITDGEENSSHITLEGSISSALKAEASIYSVNVEEQFFDDDQKEGQRILKQLADETGGNYLKAEEDGAAGAFGKIRRELRNQYALAYRPTNLAERTFHRLIVLAPNNLRVRCRRGYYAR